MSEAKDADVGRLSSREIALDALKRVVAPGVTPEHWHPLYFALQRIAALQSLSQEAVRDALSNLVSLLLQSMEPIGPMRSRSDYPPELQTAINVLKREPNAAGRTPLSVRTGSDAEADSRQVESATSACAKPAPAAHVAEALSAISKAEEVVFNAAIVADDRMRYEEAKNHRKLSEALKQAVALLAKLGQSHHFTVDLKQFLAPANRMSIAELKAIYGRGGTEFWFVKDPSDKETGRHYFHDSEIVDLKFTSEFYVDLPARM